MFAYRGRPRLGLRDLVVALVDVGAGDGLLEAELLLRLGGTGYNYFQCTRYDYNNGTVWLTDDAYNYISTNNTFSESIGSFEKSMIIKCD